MSRFLLTQRSALVLPTGLPPDGAMGAGEPATVAERTVFAPIERLTVRRPNEPRSSGSRDQLRPRRPTGRGAGGRVLYPALRGGPGRAAALRENRLRT